MSSQKKKTRKLSSGLALPSNKAADELNAGVVELIPLSDDEADSPVATSQRLPGQENIIGCDDVRTLILVEDVDILFPEDRGCIAAIQQIAETAKGPIILTGNSKMSCYNNKYLLNIKLYKKVFICLKILFLYIR